MYDWLELQIALPLFSPGGKFYSEKPTLVGSYWCSAFDLYDYEHSQGTTWIKYHLCYKIKVD